MLGVAAICQWCRRPQAADAPAIVKLILGSAVCAAAVAAAFKEPRAIQRALVIAPVGALAAARMVASVIQFLAFVRLQ